MVTFIKNAYFIVLLDFFQHLFMYLKVLGVMIFLTF